METLKRIFSIGLVNEFLGQKFVQEETGKILYSIHPAVALGSFLLIFFVGYLLGSFNFATFLSKRFYKDITFRH